MATTPRIPPVIALIVAAAERAADRLPRGHLSRLAEECGVQRNAPSTWANGKVMPEREYWTAIEAHFGMTPGTLAMAAADFFDPGYKKLRGDVRRIARERDALAADLRRLRGD